MSSERREPDTRADGASQPTPKHAGPQPRRGGAVFWALIALMAIGSAALVVAALAGR